MNINRVVSALFASTIFMQLVSCSSPPLRKTMTNRDGWDIHCFGRYLVELPPGVKIGGAYKVRGNTVEYLAGETPESLRARVEKRQAELKMQKRDGGRGSMFFGRWQHTDAGSISLLSWEGTYSTEVLLRESYMVATSPWRVFRNSGEVTTDRTNIARSNADALASRVRSRDNNAIPEEPGFCIEGGMIAGNEFQSESFTIGIELPEHPNAKVFIDSRTGAEKDRLLDRIGGFFLSATRGLTPGLKVLRKRNRDVGPIRAQEFATAASDKGQRVYAMAWESQGKDNSLAEQNISVTLQVLEQSVVTEKTPYQPAFKSDEEALQLWDNIIESVRLRPGAV